MDAPYPEVSILGGIYSSFYETVRKLKLQLHPHLNYSILSVVDVWAQEQFYSPSYRIL